MVISIVYATKRSSIDAIYQHRLGMSYTLLPYRLPNMEGFRQGPDEMSIFPLTVGAFYTPAVLAVERQTRVDVNDSTSASLAR